MRVAKRFGIYYTAPGSDGVFRLTKNNEPLAWATHAAATRYAREKFIGSPLAKAHKAVAVFVGTSENPRMFPAKKARKRRAANG